MANGRTECSGGWTAPAVRRRKRASASSTAARHKSIDARKGIGLRASKHVSDTHNRLRLPVQPEAFSFSLMLLRTVAGYALLPDPFQQLLRFAVLLHSARVRRKLRQLRRRE